MVPSEAVLHFLRHKKYKAVPNYTQNIYKVFDNLHMQWMGIWIHHHSVFTTGSSPDLENQQKSVVHCWGTNCTITHLMRLYAHPKWITHPCHSYLLGVILLLMG
jgi:hypothetical protein